jgi:hypothetical protein
MSTFYLLPPRAALARQWAGYFRQWLPELPALTEEWAEDVVGAVVRLPGVYVVFADELPDGADVTAALRDGFGADADDRVIDLRGNGLQAAA